ncbi:MAG: hypothetical protein JWS10_953 [Cypionkella sp.]|nr:hypothetical protein [Cypionkella sp.]
MHKNVAQLLKKQESDLENEGRDMWRAAVADVVMDLLLTGKVVSYQTLCKKIEAQIDLGENLPIRSQLRGAWNVLNGLPPRE